MEIAEKNLSLVATAMLNKDAEEALTLESLKMRIEDLERSNELKTQILDAMSHNQERMLTILEQVFEVVKVLQNAN